MKVYIVTHQGYDSTSILGVYATEELAQEHIDWCMTRGKRAGDTSRSNYDILEETVGGIE